MRTNRTKNEVITINAHFDRKYGKAGTQERKSFEQKAEAYMVAELVRSARLNAHMTQEELARKLNVSRAYIAKIEGASSDLRISTLRRIVESGLGGKLNINVEL